MQSGHRYDFLQSVHCFLESAALSRQQCTEQHRHFHSCTLCSGPPELAVAYAGWAVAIIPSIAYNINLTGFFQQLHALRIAHCSMPAKVVSLAPNCTC